MMVILYFYVILLYEDCFKAIKKYLAFFTIKPNFNAQELNEKCY